METGFAARRDMLDLIRDGSLERLILVVLIFGTITVQTVRGFPLDDRLVDFALVVLGFYFGSMIQQKLNSTSK